MSGLCQGTSPKVPTPENNLVAETDPQFSRYCSICPVTNESQQTMDIVLDFQGSKDNYNEFVIKELAIASTDGAFIQHWFVRSPFPLHSTSDMDTNPTKQCHWNTPNHHGIEWRDEGITIQNLHHQLTLTLKNAVVYVKGLEKVKYIEEFFLPTIVIDLEYYPALKDLPTSTVYCFFHKDSKLNCALNNVLKIVQYRNSWQ